MRKSPNLRTRSVLQQPWNRCSLSTRKDLHPHPRNQLPVRRRGRVPQASVASPARTGLPPLGQRRNPSRCGGKIAAAKIPPPARRSPARLRPGTQSRRRGQYNLDVMYDEGQGVPQYYILAHMWYNLAASRTLASKAGNRKKAVMNRDRVASKMPPAQIAEAEGLAREWKPKVEGTWESRKRLPNSAIVESPSAPSQNEKGTWLRARIESLFP